MRDHNIFRPPVRQEVDEELSFHVEMRVRELVASGLTVEEARAQAVQRFGDIEEVRAACRSLGEERDRRVRRGTWLLELWQDVRYGVRMLRRSPGYTTVAALTLALGIGATTAIFSMVHAVLLRSQPFPDADRVVVPESVNLESGDRWSITYADFEDWREHSVFEHVAVFQTLTVNVTGAVQPERLGAALVSLEFFEALGTLPAQGRAFAPEEHEVGQPRLAMVSAGLAARMFGSPQAAVDAQVEVAGRPAQVIGVLPRGLEFPAGTDVWMPLRMGPEDLQSNRRRDNFIFQGIARLREDRSLEQTNAQLGQLATVAAQLDAAARRTTVTIMATPLTNFVVGSSLSRGLWLMLGAVVFVLLIGCVNLANLQTSRASARQRELLIRSAIGASRGRLTRQLLTESAVLAAAGGLVGVVIATLGVRLLVVSAPAQLPRMEEAGVSAGVLLFATFATFASVIFFGLMPAFLAAHRDGGLRDDDGRSSGSRRGRRIGRALVTAEVALSLLLLVGAGLFLRSFAEVRGTNPGVDTARLLTFNIGLQGARYGEEESRRLTYDALLARLQRIPGVSHASILSSLPLGGGGFYLGRVFLQDGAPEPPAGPETAAQWVVISPDYFATAGIAMDRGRHFDARDRADGVPVAIVSREFARSMFGEQDPIGKRVRSWRDENLYREIVGVADDVRFFGADDEIRPVFYVPYAQSSWNSMLVMLRTPGDPAALGASAREAVHELDPTLAIGSVRTGEELLSTALAQRRFAATLLGGFAALALLLAVTGVYGVLAYHVAQRRREIGIRMALGAVPAGVARMVVGEAMRVLLLGLVLGLLGAIALSRLLGSLLFNIAPTDPLTYGGAAMLLLLVAFVAPLIPARAAARIEPLRTIR
jgi:putative ABC transport system permease protein